MRKQTYEIDLVHKKLILCGKNIVKENQPHRPCDEEVNFSHQNRV